MNELDYIEWVRRQIAADPRVAVGPGDDCAVVQWSSGRPLLVTTDMLMEGSCFLREAGGYRIGRKAMAVNLSDIASMAGQPVAAVVSLGLPRAGGAELAKDLLRGLHERAEEFGVAIVGGDTNTWTGGIVINITLFGEPTGNGPVIRAGAEPGDWVMATGEFGGSLLSHHLDFRPRVREAQVLHELVSLKAMIDVSDGLAADLRHLCDESQCGAEILADAIPVRETAGHMEGDKSRLDHALSDGEDFELLFAVSPSDGGRLLQEQPLSGLDVNLSRLGQFLPKAGLWLIQDGCRTPLDPVGYVHRFDSN